jgi:hypothetical protein
LLLSVFMLTREPILLQSTTISSIILGSVFGYYFSVRRRKSRRHTRKIWPWP